MNTIMLKWGNRGKGFLKSPKIKFGGVNMTFNLNVKKLFFVTWKLATREQWDEF